MKFQYPNDVIHTTPVAVYDEVTQALKGKCFNYKGVTMFTHNFKSIHPSSDIGKEGWEYYYSITLYSAIVFKRVSGSDMIAVTTVRVDIKEVESLVEQIMFGGNYAL